MHDVKQKGVWSRIKIKDRTKMTLPNGKVIPTWSAMEQLAAKI